MATKHGDDPWIMQLMSRRFYSEKVYDDSTSDQPKIRWRYRNFYSDDIINGQRTHENDSHSDFQGDSRRDSQINNLGNSQSESSNTRTHSRNNSDKRRINLEPNQAVRILLHKTKVTCFSIEKINKFQNRNSQKLLLKKILRRIDRSAQKEDFVMTCAVPINVTAKFWIFKIFFTLILVDLLTFYYMYYPYG